MQLNETKDALEDLVAKQDFSKAAELKSKLEELETSKVSLLEQSNVSLMEKKEEKVKTTVMSVCHTGSTAYCNSHVLCNQTYYILVLM